MGAVIPMSIGALRPSDLSGQCEEGMQDPALPPETQPEHEAPMRR